jgi:hypothetical protein
MGPQLPVLVPQHGVTLFSGNGSCFFAAVEKSPQDRRRSSSHMRAVMSLDLATVVEKGVVSKAQESDREAYLGRLAR